MARHDGRAVDALRPVEMITGFHRMSEGSVLYKAGSTVVLCTASVDPKVPAWMEGKGKGWITAEYQMHPRSNPVKRESRDGRGKAPSGRTQEIQRLIGRALRAAIDLQKLGEQQITVDCDVLEADGGTRTASITGGAIALYDACTWLAAQTGRPSAFRHFIAAISGGVVGGTTLLDLDYAEDRGAEVDLNVVAREGGGLIEVQGTGEHGDFTPEQLSALVGMASGAIRDLTAMQRAAVA